MLPAAAIPPGGVTQSGTGVLPEVALGHTRFAAFPNLPCILLAFLLITSNRCECQYSILFRLFTPQITKDPPGLLLPLLFPPANGSALECA